MKSVMVHAALLAAGASLAFWAVNREVGADSEGSVVLAALTEKDMQEVRFTWPNGEVVVRPHGKGEPRRWSVDHTLEEKSDTPEEPGDAGQAVAGDEPAERRQRRFPAGRFLERSVAQLTPLSARRSLGEVTKERLGGMGLDEPARRLVVQAKRKTYTLHIGESTFGDQARYARLEGRADVLLMDSAALRGLEGTAARLMEGRLVPVELEDIVAFEVRQRGKQAFFEHRDREQDKKRFFAAKGSSERSEEANGLLSTLRGLRTRDYLGQQALDGASELVGLKLELHEQPALEVRLWRKDDEEYLLQVGEWVGELSASGGKNLVDDVTAALPAP
jgi:hypothetical protein